MDQLSEVVAYPYPNRNKGSTLKLRTVRLHRKSDIWRYHGRPRIIERCIQMLPTECNKADCGAGEISCKDGGVAEMREVLEGAW